MIGMNPLLSFVVMKAILTSPVDFGVLNMGGVRTKEDQDKLYAQGRTTPGKKVTWTRDSKHVQGNAVDLVVFVHGKPTWESKYYKALHDHVLFVSRQYHVPVHNGFDMWGRDHPHWQLATNARNNYDIGRIKK